MTTNEENKKNGVIKIAIPKLTKVGEAYMEYYLWLHEAPHIFQSKGKKQYEKYTANVFNKIRELREQMTEKEIKEFDKKIYTKRN